jgi:hypothetical protein
MTANSLIDTTLEEIGRGYHPGVLGWMKGNRSQEWNKMVALEEKINRTTLKGDMESLKQALSNYKELILGVVEVFETPKGQGNLF